MGLVALTNPIWLFVAYALFAAGAAFVLSVFPRRVADVDFGSVHNRIVVSRSRSLIRCGCIWIVFPGVLLACIGGGAVFGPGIYSQLVFDPPKIGESLQDVENRLGAPDFVKLSEPVGEGVGTKRIGYVAPGGVHIVAILDDKDVVVEVRIAKYLSR